MKRLMKRRDSLFPIFRKVSPCMDYGRFAQDKQIEKRKEEYYG
jgi:hypothetical protein